MSLQLKQKDIVFTYNGEVINIQNYLVEAGNHPDTLFCEITHISEEKEDDKITFAPSRSVVTNHMSDVSDSINDSKATLAASA